MLARRPRPGQAGPGGRRQTSSACDRTGPDRVPGRPDAAPPGRTQGDAGLRPRTARRQHGTRTGRSAPVRQWRGATDSHTAACRHGPPCCRGRGPEASESTRPGNNRAVCRADSTAVQHLLWLAIENTAFFSCELGPAMVDRKWKAQIPTGGGGNSGDNHGIFGQSP